MKRLARSLLTLSIVSLFVTPNFAAEPTGAAKKTSAKKTVRLMTIGNSFSQDATFYLNDLAEADGNVLVLKTANVGGSPMQLHWDKAQLHEREPNNPAGLYSSAKTAEGETIPGRGLKEILSDGPHDFVTIQQASIKSHDLQHYRPYAAKLCDYVKQHAPDAELLLHETWAYRVDDPRFSVKEPKEGEPKTQREMYDMLSNAYRTTAKELGVQIIPVGDAFIAADEDENWGYRPDKNFDVKQAKPPKLPDQTHSLHVGRTWKKSKTGNKLTLGMDGHHASVAGRYLGACVWYEVLFGVSCVGNQFAPKELNAADARYLQETAHATVAKLR